MDTHTPFPSPCSADDGSNRPNLIERIWQGTHDIRKSFSGDISVAEKKNKMNRVGRHGIR